MNQPLPSALSAELRQQFFPGLSTPPSDFLSEEAPKSPTKVNEEYPVVLTVAGPSNPVDNGERGVLPTPTLWGSAPATPTTRPGCSVEAARGGAAVRCHSRAWGRKPRGPSCSQRHFFCDSWFGRRRLKDIRPEWHTRSTVLLRVGTTGSNNKEQPQNQLHAIPLAAPTRRSSRESLFLT